MQDEQEVGTIENENSRQEGSPVLTSSDSDSSEVQISKSTKKSRTKGFFRVWVEKPWKTDEKQAALLHFNTFLKKNKLPSIATLCKELPYIEELKNRSPTSVKSWLQNELVKKQGNFEPLSSIPRNIRRTRWTPALKRILNIVFADHLMLAHYRLYLNVYKLWRTIKSFKGLLQLL
ncbi:hypothetical protein RN001_003037 [Aquatica leii]|uniref:Uncharacterized protein n=1 Tax=Aquatica leii TaxID=1421715 RepID=A0AAN7PN49_9COLE|nr:hypothetical protein RN001_003037 [Aquatica leii]